MSAIQLSETLPHHIVKQAIVRNPWGSKVASSVPSKAPEAGLQFSVGERVIMPGRDGEFVVVDVDHLNGRVELLRLHPGRIEIDIPVSNITRKRREGPHLVPNT